MHCSLRTKTCWVAPALLAIFLMGSPPALATEPAASAEIAAASTVSTDSRELAGARERSSLPAAQPEQARPDDGRAVTAQDPARLDRPVMRVRRIVRRDDDRIRRDEERSQPRFRREAAAVPWHRSSVGIILGVGF
jgi:hypothetical protein